MNPLRFIRSGIILPLAYPLFSAGFCLAEDESIPGNPPKLAQSIITCADGSRWHGFTFQARLGLGYVIESSVNLESWETQVTFPGSGQTQVHLMKAAAPLATPVVPPSAPPAPLSPVPLASLLMQPAASGGGLVIGWASLDDGRPMRWHFPTLVRDEAWDDMPGYFNRFGDYNFNLSDPPFPAVPPAANPDVGPKDTAMLAAFELYFPDMNAEVIASVSRIWSQTVAPPAPVDRRFWRVRCNWGVDTDSDGTPDWMEYQQMFDAAAGNNPVTGPPPDPFNGDTDGNGAPDGSQRSSDGDNIPDALDADPDDPLIDWEKKPTFRFATFPVNPATGDPVEMPRQVNDLGDVLFEKSIWSRGIVHPWVPFAPNLRVFGKHLDDSGTVYTYGDIPLQPAGMGNGVIMFNRSGTNPKVMKTTIQYEGQETVAYAGGLFEGLEKPEMRSHVSTSGSQRVHSFLSLTWIPVPSFDESGPISSMMQIPPERNLWSWSEDGITERGAGFTSERMGFGPDGQAWEWRSDGTTSDLYLGEKRISPVKAFYWRVVNLPGGNPMAIAASPAPPLLFKDGQWSEARSFKDTMVDFSTLGRFGLKERSGFWFNGKHLWLEELAPGLPEAWKVKTSCALQDTTRGGWTLMTRHELGLQSPVVESVLGLPLFLQDDLPYSGLDDVSLTAIPFTAAPPAKLAIMNGGIQKEFWVMVPAGDGESAMRVVSPLGSQTSATFGGGPVTVTPADVGSSDALIKLSAPVTADGTSEVVPVKMGAVESISVPLRAKIMKARTLNVSIWPINRATPGQAVVNCPALPSEQEIEAFLNGIFKKQLNLTVNVTVQGAASVDYDIANNADAHLPPPESGRPETAVNPRNGQFDVNDTPTKEQTEVMKERRSVNGINIYVIGGAPELWPWGVDETGKIYPGLPLNGITNPELRACWIAAGSLAPDGGAPPPFLSTVAHEMGHVMLGKGHPNRDDGLAPLPQTDTRRRLMYSGLSKMDPILLRRQIVKAEWDEAERWMKLNLDGPNP